jgi:hypothetical protein
MPLIKLIKKSSMKTSLRKKTIINDQWSMANGQLRVKLSMGNYQ